MKTIANNEFDADELNLVTLAQQYNDEDKAREYMEFLRWGNNGPACPHCGGTDPYRLTPKAGSTTRKGVLKCRACRKQFTVTVGTVFEDSHVKLTKWIQAILIVLLLLDIYLSQWTLLGLWTAARLWRRGTNHGAGRLRLPASSRRFDPLPHSRSSRPLRGRSALTTGSTTSFSFFLETRRDP